MSYYCGIDLHSINHVVCVSDEEDKRLLERKFSNDSSAPLIAVLSEYKTELKAIAIESTGNRVQTAGGLNSLYDQQFHERGLLPLTKAGLTSITSITSSNGELVTSTGAGAFDRLLTLLLISITILRWRR